MHTRTHLLTLALLTAPAYAQFLDGFVYVDDPLGLSLTDEWINDATLDDFDADGDLDLAVLISKPIASPNNPPNDTGYEIRIYTNDGTGAFLLGTTLAIRDGDGLNFDLVSGDLNNDGLPELVTTSRVVPGSGPFDDKLVIFRNTGGLGFFGPIYYTSPGAYHGIAIADMDNDGDADILAVSAFDQVNYHKGNGSGTVFNFVDEIQTGNGSTTGDGSDQIAVADYNLDGLLDIATSNSNSNDLSLLYQRSNGLFWEGLLTTIVPHGLSGDSAIRAHDINSDGEPDLILAAGSNDLFVLYNDHDAGSESFPNFNDFTSTIPGTPSVADFVFSRVDCSGDSIVDLITANSRTSVRVGLGGDSFSSSLYTSPTIAFFPGRARVLDGDLDGDGDTDIIHVDRKSSILSNGQSMALLRNRCTELPCPADFDNDRMLDFFDVSAFLAAYNSGDLSADLNDDGVINFFDVSAFLSAFNAGCPD